MQLPLVYKHGSTILWKDNKQVKILINRIGVHVALGTCHSGPARGPAGTALPKHGTHK